MTYTNKTLARAFAQGKTDGESKKMLISGDTIFSFGFHFPIAKRLSPEMQIATGKKYVFNSNRHSNTTAQHKSKVASAINYDFLELPQCDISEEGLKNFLNEIKEEITPYKIRLDLLKTKNGKMGKGYQEKIDAATKKYNTYDSIFSNLFGGSAVILIKSLSKEARKTAGKK
jgi:uncharacterized protein YlaN (UPF0358 family)